MTEAPGIRERSGSEDGNDPLATFLYILIRDHLPAGEVEGILKKHIFPDGKKFEGDEFSNGWLARYAKDISKRLRQKI